MFLVLCSAVDQSALWAYQQLLRSGINPLQLVTTESLSYAGWRHRVSETGNAITITLPDGRVIDSRHVRGALNRITTVGAEQAKQATQSDRDYALLELNAFYLSWLHCLPGAINRATPQGLSGRWRHPSEWAALAQKAGLSVRIYRQSDTDPEGHAYAIARMPAAKAVVFRDRVFGAMLPDAVAQASGHLAKLADLDLMAVDFEITPNGKYVFVNASPSPDLFVGGTELIGALADEWLPQGEPV